MSKVFLARSLTKCWAIGGIRWLAGKFLLLDDILTILISSNCPDDPLKAIKRDLTKARCNYLIHFLQRDVFLRGWPTEACSQSAPDTGAEVRNRCSFGSF
jgi:hypothetical protein